MTQHRMTAGGIDGKPISKGFWELVFEAWWAPLFVLPMVIGLILHAFGIDFSLTLGAVPTLAIVLVMLWARNKQRRKRLARVALRDRSFECWLRHPHARTGSLSHRWAYGVCTLDADTLSFQPLDGSDGQPLGRPSVFTDLVCMGHPEIPASERRGASRSWQATALLTDRDVIELLCPDEAGFVLSEVDR